MMNPLVFIILFVSTISLSHAQDTPDPSMSPTTAPSVISSSRRSLQQSQNPLTAEECTHDPDWYYEFPTFSNGLVDFEKLKCDDDRVECWMYGNLGSDDTFGYSAESYCCKCKPQCAGQCIIVVPSQSPLTPPPTTLEPTTTKVSLPPPANECTNDPDWYYETYVSAQKLRCDDDRVFCWYYGNLGMAQSYCCKCKSECFGQCTDVATSSPTPSPNYQITTLKPNDIFDYNYEDENDDFNPINLAPVGVIIFIIMLITLQGCNNEGQHNARREANRQTMVARRQQQRQSNSQGLTEEERNHARYELFRSKFHFQQVLPDKSNIYASSLRNVSTNPDEEHPNEDKSNDDDALAVPEETSSKRSLSERFSKASLSIRQLSSWRRTSTKDECCICLESYNVGETICAAVTKECDHVFHEGCILQWVKNNDKCPLCRVDLLKE